MINDAWFMIKSKTYILTKMISSQNFKLQTLRQLHFAHDFPHPKASGVSAARNGKRCKWPGRPCRRCQGSARKTKNDIYPLVIYMGH